MTPCCDVHSLLNRQKCGLEVGQRHNERLTQSICPSISPTLPKIHSANYLLRFQGIQWRTQKVEIHQSTLLRAPHFWMFCDITDTHLTPLQGQWQQFQLGVSSSLRGSPAPTPTFCSFFQTRQRCNKSNFCFKFFLNIDIFGEDESSEAATLWCGVKNNDLEPSRTSFDSRLYAHAWWWYRPSHNIYQSCSTVVWGLKNNHLKMCVTLKHTRKSKILMNC